MSLLIPRIECTVWMQIKGKMLSFALAVVSATEKLDSNMRDVWHYFLNVFHPKVIKFNMHFHISLSKWSPSCGSILWQYKRASWVAAGEKFCFHEESPGCIFFSVLKKLLERGYGAFCCLYATQHRSSASRLILDCITLQRVKHKPGEFLPLLSFSVVKLSCQRNSRARMSIANCITFFTFAT